MRCVDFFSPALTQGAMTCLSALLSGFLLMGCERTSPSGQQFAIFGAVKNGNAALLRNEIKNGLNPDLYSEDHGYLLAQAVFSENPEVTQILLDAGADKDARRGKQATPLLRAVLIFNCEPARILLAAGASPDARFLLDEEGFEGDPAYIGETVTEIYYRNKEKWLPLWNKHAACWLEFEKDLGDSMRRRR